MKETKYAGTQTEKNLMTAFASLLPRLVMTMLSACSLASTSCGCVGSCARFMPGGST